MTKIPLYLERCNQISCFFFSTQTYTSLRAVLVHTEQ